MISRILENTFNRAEKIRRLLGPTNYINIIKSKHVAYYFDRHLGLKAQSGIPTNPFAPSVTRDTGLRHSTHTIVTSGSSFQIIDNSLLIIASAYYDRFVQLIHSNRFSQKSSNHRPSPLRSVQGTYGKPITLAYCNYSPFIFSTYQPLDLYKQRSAHND